MGSKGLVVTCYQAIESRTDQWTVMFIVLTIAYNRMPEEYTTLSFII